jgi:tetratricopeptide (TPR) repeat protein
MRIAAIFLWALAATLLGGGIGHAEKRVALVIGNSDYQNVGTLPNPARDAVAMGELFRRIGFDRVEVKTNVDRAAMRKALRDFSIAVQDAEIGVVFYAGHGIEVGGTNYLIPIDAVLERDLDVEDEAVSLDRVNQFIEPAKRLRLIILDACRDNPFAARMQRTVANRSVGRGLGRLDITTADTMVAFAAKPGSTAGDGGGVNSPYTIALLKHLATPGLDLRLAMGRVRDEVLASTDRKQEPVVFTSLGGAEFPLVPAPKGQRPIDPAGQAWTAIENTKSQAVLEDFIRRFGTTIYGSMARARLEELKSAPPLASNQQLEWAHCENKHAHSDTETVIQGCTTIIESGAFSEKTLSNIFVNRGIAYAQKRAFDPAIADFSKSIEFARTPSALVGRGNAYREKNKPDFPMFGDYKAAMTDYDEAIRIDPGYIAAYRNRAYTRLLMMDHDEAIADYSEAIRLEGASSDYANRGYSYVERARTGEKTEKQRDEDRIRAIRDYNKAIELDTHNSASYYGRSQAYMWRGDFHRAVSDLSEAIKINPRYTAAYVERARTYWIHLDEADKAIIDYDVALRLEPENWLAHANRADLYKSKGELDKAIADYSEWNRVSGGANPQALELRGDAYAEKGDYLSARTDYEAVLSIPNYHSSEDGRKLADMYTATGNFNRAIELYTDALREKADDPQSLLGRGRAYVYVGAYAQAESDFTRVLEGKSWLIDNAIVWIDISRRRNKLPSRINEDIKRLSQDNWNTEMIRRYMENKSFNDVKVNIYQSCFVNFLSGERALINGQKRDAIRYFQVAEKSNGCSSQYRVAAAAEILILGSQP